MTLLNAIKNYLKKQDETKQSETIKNKKTSRNMKFREVLKHSENVVVIAPGLLKSFLIIFKSVFFVTIHFFGE